MLGKNLFLEKVHNIRQKELSHLRKAEYLDICFSFLYSTAPSLVALAVFATYLLINKNHFLEPNMVFVSLAVINLLRFPLSSLAVMISHYIELTTTSLSKGTSCCVPTAKVPAK